MTTRRNVERGSALLTAILLMSVLMVTAGGFLVYANHQRVRAVGSSRALTRDSCAQAGLDYARAFYGRNFDKWNTYFSNPGVYNPIASRGNTADAAKATQAAVLEFAKGGYPGPFQVAHPELFSDLDGDGKNDVYIYIRDNDDELLPALPNPNRDNDHNAIIGAICISQTMVPRRQDGTLATDPLLNEALLSFNAVGTLYTAQSAGGSSGDGNSNR